MPLLIATVAEDFVLLSQDSAATDPLPAETAARIEVAYVQRGDARASAAFVGDGSPPTAALTGFANRVWSVPQLAALIGGVGNDDVVMSWALWAQQAGFASDLTNLNTLAPRYFRQMAARLPAGPLVFVHLGWSPRHGRCIGILFNRDRAFEPETIEPGHLISPAPAPDDPEAADIDARRVPAAHGVESDRYHVVVAGAIARTWRRGQYRSGLIIGGQLITARVDRGGAITVRASHRFPDHDGQAEHAHQRALWKLRTLIG